MSKHWIESAAKALFIAILATVPLGCGSEGPRPPVVLRDPDGWNGTMISARLKTLGASNERVRTVVTHGDALEAKLPFDAFLVGVEKGNAHQLNAPDGRGMGAIEQDVHLDSVRLTDPRAMFISHIAEYRATNGAMSSPEVFYNVYAAPSQTSAGSTQGAWSAGIDELDELERRIEARASNATHIIFWSTGWNNSTAESLDTLHALHDILEKASNNADPTARPFRPVYVAVTWASYWGLPGVLARASLVTKEHDADEVGASIVGRIVGSVLLPIRDRAATHPKVVLVGHSLGARVVTWGATVGSAIAKSSAGPVDVVVGLQPALSINQFKDDGKRPFPKFDKIARRLLYTCSDRDTAVDIASWQPYIGDSAKAVPFAKAHPESFFLSRTISGREETPVKLDARPTTTAGRWDRVWLLDATSIIANHNDVVGYDGARNEPIGSLIWSIINE